MSTITKNDIAGAYITAIHAEYRTSDGLDFATIYFTVDRGFSFTMPYAGQTWETSQVSQSAKRFKSFSDTDSFLHRIFSSFRSREEVRLMTAIKTTSITGAYCPTLDDEGVSFEPDDSVLLFSDGSQAWCMSAAPTGTGAAGLYFRTDPHDLHPRDSLIDFFQIPLESKTEDPPTNA